MNVLAVIRNKEELPSVIDYADKVTSQGDELYVMNIIAIPGEIPTSKNGIVLEGCTEFDLSPYYNEKREHEKWINTASISEIPVQREVAIGDRITILKDRISKWGIDLILTSSELDNEMRNLIHQTRTERIKNEIDIPILNLKCDRRKEKIDHIALLSDFVQFDDIDTSILKHIKRIQEAGITLFGFCKSAEEIEVLESRMDRFAEFHSLQDVKKKVLISADKETSIQGMLMEYPIQLMVIVDLQRTGLKRLFKGDLESDILNHMLVPILAL